MSLSPLWVTATFFLVPLMWIPPCKARTGAEGKGCSAKGEGDVYRLIGRGQLLTWDWANSQLEELWTQVEIKRTTTEPRKINVRQSEGAEEIEKIRVCFSSQSCKKKKDISSHKTRPVRVWHNTAVSRGSARKWLRRGAFQELWALLRKEELSFWWVTGRKERIHRPLLPQGNSWRSKHVRHSDS